MYFPQTVILQFGVLAARRRALLSRQFQFLHGFVNVSICVLSGGLEFLFHMYFTE